MNSLENINTISISV